MRKREAGKAVRNNQAWFPEFPGETGQKIGVGPRRGRASRGKEPSRGVRIIRVIKATGSLVSRTGIVSPLIKLSGISNISSRSPLPLFRGEEGGEEGVAGTGKGER